MTRRTYANENLSTINGISEKARHVEMFLFEQCKKHAPSSNQAFLDYKSMFV